MVLDPKVISDKNVFCMIQTQYLRFSSQATIPVELHCTCDYTKIDAIILYYIFDTLKDLK